MTAPNDIRVALVIVLFRPDDDDLRHARMMAADCEGIIVDNSDAPAFATDRVGRMAYRCFGRNLGIAEAQNIALRTLLADTERAFTHFVLLDQDSRTTADFPLLMATAFETAAARAREGKNIATPVAQPSATQPLAALGPTIIDKQTGAAYSSAFHTPPEGTPHFTPQREIIASGMCLSRAALEHVGLNDEGLFIDMVDHEWCWRAASLGYVVGTTPLVRLEHMVGRRPLRVGRQTILTAAPQRYFYLCRNYLLLLRRPYVPRQWKVAMGFKRMAEIVVIPLTQRDGFRALPHMFRGFWHGLRNKASQPSFPPVNPLQ